MEEISVIRATDPDGSVFKAVMDALSGKRAEVVDVAEQSASVLRIGDLDIYCIRTRIQTTAATATAAKLCAPALEMWMCRSLEIGRGNLSPRC